MQLADPMLQRRTPQKASSPLRQWNLLQEMNTNPVAVAFTASYIEKEWKKPDVLPLTEADAQNVYTWILTAPAQEMYDVVADIVPAAIWASFSSYDEDSPNRWMAINRNNGGIDIQGWHSFLYNKLYNAELPLQQQQQQPVVQFSPRPVASPQANFVPLQKAPTPIRLSPSPGSGQSIPIPVLKAQQAQQNQAARVNQQQAVIAQQQNIDKIKQQLQHIQGIQYVSVPKPLGPSPKRVKGKAIVREPVIAITLDELIQVPLLATYHAGGIDLFGIPPSRIRQLFPLTNQKNEAGHYMLTWPSYLRTAVEQRHYIYRKLLERPEFMQQVDPEVEKVIFNNSIQKQRFARTGDSKPGEKKSSPKDRFPPAEKVHELTRNGGGETKATELESYFLKSYGNNIFAVCVDHLIENERARIGGFSVSERKQKAKERREANKLLSEEEKKEAKKLAAHATREENKNHPQLTVQSEKYIRGLVSQYTTRALFLAACRLFLAVRKSGLFTAKKEDCAEALKGYVRDSGLFTGTALGEFEGRLNWIIANVSQVLDGLKQAKARAKEEEEVEFQYASAQGFSPVRFMAESGAKGVNRNKIQEIFRFVNPVARTKTFMSFFKETVDSQEAFKSHLVQGKSKESKKFVMHDVDEINIMFHFFMEFLVKKVLRSGIREPLENGSNKHNLSADSLENGLSKDPEVHLAQAFDAHPNFQLSSSSF